MKSLSYTSTLFYVLPEDFSSGSREVLIAIAFIIAKNLPDLINEEIKRSPFDDSFSLIDLENIDIHKPEVPNMTGDKDKKNYVMWLKGRTRQNKKMTQEYDSQITKIYDKVHCWLRFSAKHGTIFYNQFVTIIFFILFHFQLNSILNHKATGKLTLNEILALSSENYCKGFLEKCSHIMDLLECYQEWTRKQKIFWKWMVSRSSIKTII